MVIQRHCEDGSSGFLFARVWIGVISFPADAPAWSRWISLLCTATAFSLYVYPTWDRSANPGIKPMPVQGSLVMAARAGHHGDSCSIYDSDAVFPLIYPQHADDRGDRLAIYLGMDGHDDHGISVEDHPVSSRGPLSIRRSRI